MTLEEAIEIYTSNAEYERTHGSLQGCMDFKQLAEWLKELKAYKEQGEDYISRNVAIVQLSHNKIGDNDCDVIIQKDIETIKALPPVTPQPKTGRWINGNSICPCCGEDKFKDLDADIWSDWKPKYCPNCGAKMAESEEKE